VPRTRMFALWLLLAATMLAAWRAHGHEIPSDVTVSLWAQPAEDRLHLLVRVPLEAMQDIEFPLLGPGYLDIGRADTALRNAALLWLASDLRLYADGQPLPTPTLQAVRASLPSDRSFASFDTALAHVLGPPLPPGTQLIWRQALLDASFEVPVESSEAQLAVNPSFARLGMQVRTVVRFTAPNGATRVLQLEGDSGVVTLDPRWHQSLLRFLDLGFEHILDGADHLLFLLCLVVPFRREPRALLVIVTGFTVGHSITLLGSAYGWAPAALWFPPLVETLIAASILYMAIENGVWAGGNRAMTAGSDAVRRGALAAGFGLIHGFGFSFALRDSLQLAGDHIITALLAFNVGIELGQLLVVLLLAPALYVLFRFVLPERAGTIVLALIVGHTAWHWLAERFTALREYDLSAPLY
jgi:hypothetical protein